MARLSDKLDQIISDINQIKVVQAEQGVLHRKNSDDLERHIKRTDLAEKRIEMLTLKDSELKIEVLKEIEPIKSHINLVNGLVKGFLVLLGVIGSVILGLDQIGLLSKLLALINT